MRYRMPWAASLLIVALLASVSWGSRAQTQAWQVWEYKIIQQYGSNPMSPSLGEKELNKLGAEGWELVGIRSGDTGTGMVRTDYHFKRGIR